MVNIVYMALNFILEYLTYFVGGAIQFFFMLLPIMLKNWDDDALNSITYVSFQMFIAGIIYIIAPWVLESKPISGWSLVLLIFGSGLISFFRVIFLIPFEFTYPIKIKSVITKNLVFLGFHTNERLKYLASLDFKEYDAEIRYNALREKLVRIRINKSENGDELDDDLED